MTLVMGILNVTPDSFSDGGRFLGVDEAIAHAHALAASGADIIDVGGESTRPGATRVTPEAEQVRVLDLIQAIALPTLPTISIDTMNASTALAAVAAGVRIVNDVSGGLADPDMLPAVATTDADIVLQHWRGHSADMYARAHYDDIVSEVIGELAARTQAGGGGGRPPPPPPRGPVPPPPRLDLGLGLAKAKPLQGQLPDMGQAPHVRQPGVQRVPLRALLEADRREDRQPVGGGAGDEVGEGVEGGGVGPLEVVHDEHGGRLRSDAQQHRLDPGRDCAERELAAPDPHRREQVHQPPQAGEGPRANRPFGPRRPPVEGGGEGRVGQARSAEPDARAPQHDVSGRPGRRARLLHEPGLAHSGLAVDDDGLRLAPGSKGQHLAQPAHLPLPTDQ